MRSFTIAILLALLLPAQAIAAERITQATPVRLDGVGPIRIGMKFREAKRLTGQKFSDPEAYDATGDTKACTFVTFRNGPKDLSLMLIHGVVARIDVYGKGKTHTEEGIGLGSSERDIRRTYRGAKIDVAPSFYDGDAGREFIVTVKGQPKLFYFFATDTKKVVGMRIGRRPELDYVEGCL